MILDVEAITIVVETAISDGISRDDFLKIMDHMYIKELMMSCKNRSDMAMKGDINRGTLLTKMREYGLDN